METRVLCWMLILVIGTAVICSAKPSVGSNDEVGNVDVSDKVDGYEFATLYAVDTFTRQEKKQTLLDIEEFTSDLTSDDILLSLHLTSGAKLRMSLKRRPIDMSGIKVTELTEDGDTKVIEPRAVSCFFTGNLEGKGFASLSTCDGKLMGTISTPSRHYEINQLPEGHQSGDEVIVLVTWQNAAHEDMVLQQQLSKLSSNVGFEITEQNDEDESNKVARHSVSDRSVTIEIADYLDKYYIEELRRTKLIKTSEEIMNFIYHKWNGVARVLSNFDAIGWKITVRLVQVNIWRKHPEWYFTSTSDSLWNRPQMLCAGTFDETFDVAFLHTANITVPPSLGLSWPKGACTYMLRCAVSQSTEGHHRVELHELGHTLGLLHDWEMPECMTDTDQSEGFMGYTDMYNFRNCYRKYFDEMFTDPEKMCLHIINNPDIGVELP